MNNSYSHIAYYHIFSALHNYIMKAQNAKCDFENSETVCS